MPMKTSTKNGERKSIVQVAAVEAWHRWLDGLATHVGHDKSTTIDLALRDAAKAWGYDERAPKR